jgi:hypothetical protein
LEEVHYETTVEADFVPCSIGFRPEKTPRMALSIIAEKTQAGYTHVVDVDLKSYSTRFRTNCF